MSKVIFNFDNKPGECVKVYIVSLSERRSKPMIRLVNTGRIINFPEVTSFFL